MLEILKTILASPFEIILFICGFFSFLLGVLPVKGKLNGLPLEGPFPSATRRLLWIVGVLLMMLSIGMWALKTYPLVPPPPVVPTSLPTATPSPTATSSPTPMATPSPVFTPIPTATPTPAAACRYDAYVTDEGRYPDPREGPLVPGQQIIVEWTITNKSSCAWGSGLRWTFTGSKAIGVPPFLSLREVGIGESIKLHERISAPSTPGHYEGWWQMRDPAGNPFGDRSRIEMDVQVPELPPAPSYCTNGALFLADLTYEDNPAQGIIPVVSPGQRIYKAWLLKNTGTCHWVEGYRLVYAGGTELAWESPYVPPTASGSKAVVLVTLFAPTAPGEYKMYWRMEDPSGNRFGDTIWVRIKVGE